MSTKSISKEELQDKIDAAEESHELVAGTVIKIQKASLGKNGVTIGYNKVITREFPDAHDNLELRQYENPGVEPLPFLPHPDLKYAFDLIRVHLMIACQQKEAYNTYGDLIAPVTFESFSGEDYDNPLNKFKVTSFEVNDSETGVKLIGHRYTRGKGILALSQYVDFHGGIDGYEFGEELYHVIKHASSEVLAYYYGKLAFDNQFSIDFDDAASDMEN